MAETRLIIKPGQLWIGKDNNDVVEVSCQISMAFWDVVIVSHERQPKLEGTLGSIAEQDLLECFYLMAEPGA